MKRRSAASPAPYGLLKNSVGVNSDATPGFSGETSDDFRFVARKHIGTYVAAALVLVICGLIVESLITNQNFQWDVVGEYVFSSPILEGLALTLILSLVGMPTGVAIGIIVALMRLSRNRLLQIVSSAYIWFFLATPLLIQVIFWFNIAALYPKLSLGFVSVSVNTVITPFVAATLALSLHEGAYMAEIIRGGILSVPHGQIEASRSIGMTGAQALRRIVLPQSLRVIIPPTASRVITFVKNTSLVSVTGLAELLYTAQLIYSRTYQTIPLLVVASLWYLALTTILSFGQRSLERRFSRGVLVSGVAG